MCEHYSSCNLSLDLLALDDQYSVSPFCDLHYMTISVMVTDKLAQGLVCSTCCMTVSHVGGLCFLGFFAVFFVCFLYYHADCGNCFFTSLVVWLF